MVISRYSDLEYGYGPNIVSVAIHLLKFRKINSTQKYNSSGSAKSWWEILSAGKSCFIPLIVVVSTCFWCIFRYFIGYTQVGMYRIRFICVEVAFFGVFRVAFVGFSE